MKRVIGIAVASMMSCGAEVAAGPIENETIAAFESYCIENADQLSAIPRMMATLGAKPLGGTMATMLLNGQSGKGWLLGQTSTKMFLALTDAGVCTVYSRDASPVEARKVFSGTFRQKFLRSEPIGSQTEQWFLVSQVSRSGGEDIHAVVIINASELETIPGIILNAIPETVATGIGLSVTEWP